MYQSLRSPGASTSEQTQLPTGLQVGLGARVASTTRHFGQGALQQTGNNFDVAIKGQGFFQITMPDGSTGYTRDGAFQVDSAGQLVTPSGYPVQPGITIPANAQTVTIATDGTVSVVVSGQTQPSSTRPAWSRAEATSSRRRPPRARPTSRRPAAARMVRFSRASSRAATSTSSRSWCR
jgi:flagellar basal-body rod protein FlgG